MGIFLTLKKIPWVTKKEYLIIISNIINQKSNKKKENINLGIVSWSNTKFSNLTSSELYDRQ